jgi:nucleotide-binding universal stress UspA family protein
MIKNILVATDSSEHSVRAIACAVELARRFKAEIELFHVIYLSGMFYAADFYSYSLAITDDQMEQLVMHVMEQTLANVDIDGVVVKKKIVTGHPATEILAESARGFDLLVMGSRGHTPLTGTLVGSVTLRVLGKATCPVLVVK